MESVGKIYTFDDIIGVSTEIIKLKEYALKAASSSSPILVYGETGTGKELFVQAIHNSSMRKDKPFVALNCAALPENLLEGILFGTVRGSFTGAEDREGLFEIADGGTLYLDELNSMPIELQAKLLRVIEERRVRRVGALDERAIDVRIIASTNIKPEHCVKNGIIRSDLYYRLNVITLTIPELRNRKVDIVKLAKHFIEKYNLKFGTNVIGISEDSLEKMLCYDWPGNVRELQNVIEGIMNFKQEGIIEIEDLPERIRNSENNSLQEMLQDVEIRIIKEALVLWNNNISKAAKYLRVPRQTLQYKVKKYRIEI
jgi:arginine utilization regulatory protein